MSDEYRQFFEKADKDKSGTLSFQEVSDVLSKKGFTDQAQLKKFFGGVDINNDDKITLEEYLIAMNQVPPEVAAEAAMRSAFHDLDTDGSGTISADELKKMITSCEISDDQAQRLLAQVDTDGSGDVNFEEFVARFYGR